MLKRTQQSFTSTFKPRAKSLAPVKKGTAATRRQASAACPLDAHCYACGTSQQLTRSHILTQKQHPRQAANPLNVLTLCWPCHEIWENQKGRFAQLYPEAWAEKLRRMRQLDANAYAFFCQKHGGGPSL
jgi:hypothetical protein